MYFISICWRCMSMLSIEMQVITSRSRDIVRSKTSVEDGLKIRASDFPAPR